MEPSERGPHIWGKTTSDSSSEVKLPGFTLATDGRPSIAELYGIWERELSQNGWRRVQISSQSWLHDGQEFRVPIDAYISRFRHSPIGAIIDNGTHGGDEPEPVLAFSEPYVLDKLNRVAERVEVAFFPLLNPYGFFLGGEGGHLDPLSKISVTEAEYLFRHGGKSCRVSRDIYSFVRKLPIDSRTICLDGHADPPIDPTDQRTFSYVAGKDFRNPVVTDIGNIVQGDKNHIIQGNSKFGSINRGFVFNPQDESWAQALTQVFGAGLVVTPETNYCHQNPPPLAERVQTYVKVADVFLGHCERRVRPSF